MQEAQGIEVRNKRLFMKLRTKPANIDEYKKVFECCLKYLIQFMKQTTSKNYIKTIHQKWALWFTLFDNVLMSFFIAITFFMRNMIVCVVISSYALKLYGIFFSTSFFTSVANFHGSSKSKRK